MIQVENWWQSTKNMLHIMPMGKGKNEKKNFPIVFSFTSGYLFAMNFLNSRTDQSFANKVLQNMQNTKELTKHYTWSRLVCKKKKKVPAIYKAEEIELNKNKFRDWCSNT